LELSPERKAIRCGGIYRAKKNEHGADHHLKSRLGAKGHSERAGIDIMMPLLLLETKWFSESFFNREENVTCDS
jgi:hypothetical protein